MVGAKRRFGAVVKLIQLTSLREVYLNVYSTWQKASVKFMALLTVVNVGRRFNALRSGRPGRKNNANLDIIVSRSRHSRVATFRDHLKIKFTKLNNASSAVSRRLKGNTLVQIVGMLNFLRFRAKFRPHRSTNVPRSTRTR